MFNNGVSAQKMSLDDKDLLVPPYSSNHNISFYAILLLLHVAVKIHKKK
jgi:hypothetical protein